MFRLSSLFLLLALAIPACSQKKVRLTSPDGSIIFSFTLTKKAPAYQVSYKGKLLVNESSLSLSFLGGDTFGTDLRMAEPVFTEVNEAYSLVVGKVTEARDQHRGVSIRLFERTGRKRQVNLVVRAFNDGLAFRYEFPKQEGWESYSLVDEETTFSINGNPTVHTLLWDHYTSSHEGPYQIFPLDRIKDDMLMDVPALFAFPDKTFMAITEASLRDYAGMYLTRRDGVLRSALSPLPGQSGVSVKAALPHETPWRVIMISDRIGALLESNILTNLNEPSRIEDTSWIKPGKTSFHWWNGDITPDTTFAPGVNFETNKYYIDFCARNGIAYHAVIGYGGFAWYKSDASGYSVVGPDTDVTQTVPSLDMQQVCDYAREKGVGIHVWVHWKAIYPKLEEAFSQFEKWGIKGMMVDFMDRDDQEMVNIQEEILQTAAAHRMYIQFHGAFKPTGMHRTYPNEFTREGAMNYEYNKWMDRGLSPEHDLNVVFTRLLAGATDYHLGGFRAVPDSAFKTQFTRPLMIGTRCHMLAMYVVLESYLASVCDYPDAYRGEPGFEFLREVPTTWDKTYVPQAEVGEYVTMVREKDGTWYVGSLNNSKSRTLEIPLDFLPPGNFRAEIYSDAPDVARNPNHLIKEIRVVSKADVIKLTLGPGGGQVMRLIKQ